MARLDERCDTYFATVRGMCRTCRRVVPARVFFSQGKVWQQSLCPDNDSEPALIASDVDWYLKNCLAAFADRSPLPGASPSRYGCPHDCGPCAWHASPCQLPVLSVTNACNLECPICFTYNRPDKVWHMPLDEMRRTVQDVVDAAGRVDLINVTGGEPTLHPQILELLACCKRPEIGRVTMNTNGLRLARDPELCSALASLGVYVILSFDTFDSQASAVLHGRDVVAEKLEAIEQLGRAGVKLTLLMVMVRGINEDAVAGILDLMRTNDHVLSVTVQTMTYTGQGGGSFGPRRHLSVDEAARILCEHSGGQFTLNDFLPRPAAHPLCYLTCYLLKYDTSFLPFARLAPPERLADLMRESYLMRLEDDAELLRQVVNDMFARGDSAQLGVVRGLIEQLYPRGRALDAFERQRVAEEAVRTIYVHAHMDEDTFDCTRAMLCPDLVPTEPGRLVPACTYNLFYRMKDPRFWCENGRGREAQ